MISEDLLPSESDVAHYREHGWYISKKIFTDEQLDAAIDGQEKYYAAELEPCDIEGLNEFIRNWGPKGDYGNALRKFDYASFFRQELRAIVTSEIVGAIAARLAGTDEIRLWHDQLLYKPPMKPGEKTNVGWHTDRGYWKLCTSSNMLTAWVPFHDCDEEIGTITMVDGSHQWPDNTEALDFFSDDLDALAQKFQTGGKPVDFIPMRLERGQASFHHCLTIHGSGPNRSNQPRRSVAIHLQDGANRYQDAVHPDGSPVEHFNTRIARQVDGKPDFADPRAFPTLWKANGA